MNISKQKVRNFVLTLETGEPKIPQNFLRNTWKTEYEKSNTINYILKSKSKLYTNDNQSKYSSNPMNILKSATKKIWNSIPSALPELLLLIFLENS